MECCLKSSKICSGTKIITEAFEKLKRWKSMNQSKVDCGRRIYDLPQSEDTESQSNSMEESANPNSKSVTV